MSATKLPPELWEVHFAYQGRTVRHWTSIMTLLDCTEREAIREATRAYVQDLAAVDMMVVPLTEEDRL